jgi:RNA polymerase sigma-70 factor (ECF subfamily)
MRAHPAVPGSGQFPATRWTLIAAARSDPAARRAALEELLAQYWTPLYCFARRKGLDVDSAQDAVQGFIARLLERDAIARVDPARGRFRSYLRTALAHHLANEHAHATAQKRGGAAVIVALDFDVAERRLDGAPSLPEQAFEREWALGVMERALARLRGEFDDGQRRGPFALVAAFFGGAATPPSYENAAAAHGMSAPQLKAFLHRARVRYRELLRDEVAQTVDDPAAIDDEIRALLQALSG